MSYQHYFKHDVHDRGYDHDVNTSRNNGYMTPSLTSPVAVKQEPRDLTYDNGGYASSFFFFFIDQILGHILFIVCISVKQRILKPLFILALNVVSKTLSILVSMQYLMHS